MHALVPAVLLGLSGGNALDLYAEPEPPDRELPKAVETPTGEGRPIVETDGERQAARLEYR